MLINCLVKQRFSLTGLNVKLGSNLTDLKITLNSSLTSGVKLGIIQSNLVSQSQIPVQVACSMLELHVLSFNVQIAMLNCNLQLTLSSLILSSLSFQMVSFNVLA